jgi:hypothetical protein
MLHRPKVVRIPLSRDLAYTLENFKLVRDGEV